MKYAKKALSLLLCLAMVLSLTAVSVFAVPAANGLSVSAVDDKSGTVTVTVKTAVAANLGAISCTMTASGEGLTLGSFTGALGEAWYNAGNNDHITYTNGRPASALTEIAAGTTLFTVTYTYDAPLAEGTYTFSATNVTVSVKESVQAVAWADASSSFEIAEEAYDITVPTSLTGGTVSANKTSAKQGVEVTLTVSPSTGYVLKSLTVDGTNKTTEGKTGTVTFTMPDHDVTVTAAFEPLNYSATAALAESSIVLGDEGVTVNFTAVKDVNGGNSSVAQSNSIGLKADVVFTPASGSAVTLSDKALVFTGDGAAKIELSVADLSGLVAGTYTVAVTGKALSTGGTFAVTPASLSLTVNAKPLAITVNEGADHGDVTVVTEAVPGTTVEVTIAPASGWRVKEVKVNDGAALTPTAANKYSFTMPGAAATVYVTYEELYTINNSGSPVITAVSPTEAGAGDTVTLTVDPTKVTTGYTLQDVTYTKDSKAVGATKESDTKYTFVMPAATTEVNVTTATKKITVSYKNGNDVITTQTVDYGTTSLTMPKLKPAQPSTLSGNYKFNGWTLNGTTKDAGASMTGLSLTTDTTLTADWVEDATVAATISAAVADTDVTVEEQGVAGKTEVNTSEATISGALAGKTAGETRAVIAAEAANVAADENLSTAAQTPTVSETDAIAALVKAGLLDDADVAGAAAVNVKVIQEVYLDVKVEEFTADTNGNTLTVDITPMIQTLVTKENVTNSASLETQKANGNVVALGEATEARLDGTTEITVTIPLPANFTGDTATTFVIHNPDTAKAEQLKLEAGSTVTSLKVKVKDFSPFAVSTVTEATVTGSDTSDGDYGSLQAAVNAVANGGTITLAVAPSSDTLIAPPTAKTFTIAPGATGYDVNGITFTNSSSTGASISGGTVTSYNLSSGYSGGGSSTATVRKNTTSTPNGSYTLSSTTARAGSTVTITPKPNAGYEVDTVTVTDKNGKAVAVTKNANGTYSFVVPSGLTPVKTDVTFKKSDVLDPYTDVNKAEWYAPALRYVIENGYMTGVGETEFGPNMTISRAMIAKLLANMAKADTTPAANEQWYDKAVAWAVKNGIFDGTNPEAPALREEFATMLYNYVKTTGKGFTGDWSYTLTNPDADDVQAANREAMQWMVTNKVINGMDAEGTLAPQGTTTRAQFAQMLLNLSNVK